MVLHRCNTFWTPPSHTEPLLRKINFHTIFCKTKMNTLLLPSHSPSPPSCQSCQSSSRNDNIDFGWGSKGAEWKCSNSFAKDCIFCPNQQREVCYGRQGPFKPSTAYLRWDACSLRRSEYWSDFLKASSPGTRFFCALKASKM